MLAQIGTRLIREQRIHQNVLFRLSQIADLFFKFGEGGGDERTRCHIRIEHLRITHDLSNDLLIHRTRSFAVVTADVVFHFLGNDAPALARENVEDRLSANDLRHRRNERRIADFSTHARSLP